MSCHHQTRRDLISQSGGNRTHLLAGASVGGGAAGLMHMYGASLAVGLVAVADFAAVADAEEVLRRDEVRRTFQPKHSNQVIRMNSRRIHSTNPQS